MILWIARKWRLGFWSGYSPGLVSWSFWCLSSSGWDFGNSNWVIRPIQRFSWPWAAGPWWLVSNCLLNTVSSDFWFWAQLSQQRVDELVFRSHSGQLTTRGTQDSTFWITSCYNHYFHFRCFLSPTFKCSSKSWLNGCCNSYHKYYSWPISSDSAYTLQPKMAQMTS